MNEQQTEVVKGLTLANEFMKVLRSFKLEQERDNPIPNDVGQALANAQLDLVMEKNGLDPEHLVWGLVQVIEMFLKLTDTSPEELSGAIDHFIEFAKEQDNQ